MSEDTGCEGMKEDSENNSPKKTTVSVRQDILDRLHAIEIVEKESPSSIIGRLLDEHELKVMQKVVRKCVR